MKKEIKQISIIIIFLVIGCVMGYFVATEQIKQLSNPDYITLLNSKRMSSFGLRKKRRKHLI